jgi:hypothetical protein
MIGDETTIKACIAADQATCVGPCKWRKGKDVATNMDIDVNNKELFASNFCHPPTTDNWEQAAPACLTQMTQPACE